MQLRSSAILMQACIHGFLTRQRFLCWKRHKAATIIQVNDLISVVWFFLLKYNNTSLMSRYSHVKAHRDSLVTVSTLNVGYLISRSCLNGILNTALYIIKWC